MAGRPGRGRRPRAADRARLRAERARRRRDRRPRRGAGRLAAAAARGSSSPASRRSSSTRSRPTTCRPTPRELRVGPRIAPGRAAARAVRPRLRARSLEVAGRGEFARRGGIVDVFPPSAAAADPDRVLRRRDRLAAGVRSDRPADDRAGRAGRRSCPRRSSCSRPAARPRSASASAACAARLPERLAADLARFEGDADDPCDRRRGPIAGRSRRRRRRGLGRPPRPGDRPRPHRSRHAPRARRARRHRRGRRLPVAPGRRAPRRAGRGRRAAQGLAVDVPAAARLEEPARRRRGRSS